MIAMFPETSLRKASFVLYVPVIPLTVSFPASDVTMLVCETPSSLIHSALGMLPKASLKPTYSALVDEVTV